MTKPKTQKVIIIGASSGIGKTLAELLSQEGYFLGIMARRENLLKEIQDKSLGGIKIKEIDIDNFDNIASTLNELVVELGGVDIVINCAGIGFENNDFDFEKDRNTLDTNVLGFTAVANFAVQYFIEKGKGHLVCITSIAGLRGEESSPSYSATKAYQINYLEGLRKRIFKSKLPIVLTDVRPGFVDTKMAQGNNLFWVASKEKAAKQIYVAILKKKECVYITKRWFIVAWLMKIAPRNIYKRI